MPRATSEQQRSKALRLGVMRRQAMWERALQADELRQAGWRVRAIAGVMGVSKTTVYRWMQMLDRYYV